MNGYNFTERVRKVLAMAREEAARLHHEYVGTEHILLGLIREGEGVAAAVQNAAFVFEAAPEKMALKQAIFAEIEAAAPATAILCSNTSVMPITQIMANLGDKTRALGTHWWNPPHLIPLVEVIRTADTSESAMEATTHLLAGAGKTPVRVEKDVPGFIGNRLQHALWRFFRVRTTLFARLQRRNRFRRSTHSAPVSRFIFFFIRFGRFKLFKS